MGRGVTAICIGVAGNSEASTKICVTKMFDFRRKTLFCLGYHLSKHKMTLNSKVWVGPWPLCPHGCGPDKFSSWVGSGPRALVTVVCGPLVYNLEAFASFIRVFIPDVLLNVATKWD